MFETIIKLLTKYWPIYLEGLWGTIWISVVVVLLGSIIGALLAFGKMSKKRILNIPINIYIEIVRGTPILLQLVFFYFGVAELVPFELPKIYWIIMALVVNSSAYVAEVIRSGINAVDKGQFEAAKSLGLPNKLMMRKIIMPQAIKNILPALGNEFVMMIKETSLASLYYIPSLMTSEILVSGATYQKIESLIIVGVLYLMITLPLSQLVNYYERKFALND